MARKVRKLKTMTYSEFVASKATIAEPSGFEVHRSQLHPSTMPHQADMVLWAAAHPTGGSVGCTAAGHPRAAGLPDRKSVV